MHYLVRNLPLHSSQSLKFAIHWIHCDLLMNGCFHTMRLLGRLDNAAVDNRLAVSESCIVQFEQLVEEAEESRDNSWCSLETCALREHLVPLSYFTHNKVSW